MIILIGEERADLFVIVISERGHLYAPIFVLAHLALCQRYVIHDVYTSSTSLLLGYNR